MVKEKFGNGEAAEQGNGRVINARFGLRQAAAVPFVGSLPWYCASTGESQAVIAAVVILQWRFQSMRIATSD